MKDGFWMLLCAACLLLSARSVQARELTALDIFAQLPITLFENTPEGLSEDEKLWELVWGIRTADPDYQDLMR